MKTDELKRLREAVELKARTHARAVAAYLKAAGWTPLGPDTWLSPDGSSECSACAALSYQTAADRAAAP
jgi:hypothetical protein